jgi:DNA invertase Pin-like site-specific DNA recombinase
MIISYITGLKALARKKNTVRAVRYLRTSSATNVGAGKDSEKRQRAAIEAFAKRAGYSVAEGDVKGAGPVTERPGFKAMLTRIAGNGVRTVLVEDASRFARDLIVQLTGHDYPRKLGVTLIAANAPDHFPEDTPTAVLTRQVLRAVAQFEKANLVGKLKGARDRKKATTGKCGGRYGMLERNPYVVRKAKRLAEEKHRSLREIAEESKPRATRARRERRSERSWCSGCWRCHGRTSSAALLPMKRANRRPAPLDALTPGGTFRMRGSGREHGL